jgi:hypothetical protein
VEAPPNPKPVDGLVAVDPKDPKEDPVLLPNHPKVFVVVAVFCPKSGGLVVFVLAPNPNDEVLAGAALVDTPKPKPPVDGVFDPPKLNPELLAGAVDVCAPKPVVAPAAGPAAVLPNPKLDPVVLGAVVAVFDPKLNPELPAGAEVAGAVAPPPRLKPEVGAAEVEAADPGVLAPKLNPLFAPNENPVLPAPPVVAVLPNICTELYCTIYSK